MTTELDIDVGLYQCQECDWTGEFAPVTDTGSKHLVECPHCGTGGLETEEQ